MTELEYDYREYCRALEDMHMNKYREYPTHAPLLSLIRVLIRLEIYFPKLRHVALQDNTVNEYLIRMGKEI